MKHLGRTCLLWFVLYLILAALIGALVYERFPRPEVAIGGGLGAGFFVWVCVGYFAGVRTKGTEAQQIRRAMEGGRPPDGERVAIAGTVSGSVEVLESPITRKRCLAYEYKAIPPQNEQLAAWQGIALAPTTIEGPSGSVRLLAAPELEFEGEPLGSHEHRRNFREYVAKTTFVEQTGVNFRRDFAHLKEVNTDDDGRIRDDVHGLASDNMDDLTLTEKVLAPGDRVVAFGWYSSARGGLVPDEKAVLRSIRIVKGEPEEILRKVARKRPRDLLMGCGCLVPVIVAAIAAIVVVPLAAIEQIFPEKDASWIEIRAERHVRELVTRARLMPDMGTPTIDLAPGAARGKLTWHGATSHFDHASATRGDENVDLSLTSESAKINVRFRKDGTLQSVDVGNFMLPTADVEVELTAMNEEEIRGRITYLSPKNDPSLRITFCAKFE